MQVVSLVTQKGGSGKSTLSLSLGVAAHQAGMNTLLIDLDPQGTLSRWYDRREAETPAVGTMNPSALANALQGLEGQGYDIVFIDTPGRDDAVTSSVIAHSDFCLIPCRPSLPDIEAVQPTAAGIARMNKRHAFVLNQTQPRGFGIGSRINEAERVLRQLGTVAPVAIVARNDHQDAQGLGLGVTEFQEKGKAAHEVHRLWNWLKSELGEMHHAQARTA